jgi:hypothetical protein
MSLTALFENSNAPIEHPAMVVDYIRPFVEFACTKEPDSVLLQEIRKFVDDGLLTCSQSQLHAIAYHLNGDQLFMLDELAPEPPIVAKAPLLRPASSISTEEQDDFIRELEQFTITEKQ